jgi:hypothetical protein
LCGNGTTATATAATLNQVKGGSAIAANGITDKAYLPSICQ